MANIAVMAKVDAKQSRKSKRVGCESPNRIETRVKPEIERFE